VIRNDQELAVTQKRIAYFERLLAKLRVSARPSEFPSVATGYRAEIERMHGDVIEYLTRHATEPAAGAMAQS
jgi:hypothetical protein